MHNVKWANWKTNQAPHLKTPPALGQYGAALTMRLDGNWEMPTEYPTFPGLLMVSLPLALRERHRAIIELAGLNARMDESCARCDNQGPRAQPYFAALNATAMVNAAPVGRDPEDIPEQAVASAATVITNQAPTTSLALTTTPTTPPRQATGDTRVALSDDAFGMLIAAQKGDMHRLKNFFRSTVASPRPRLR